MIAKGFRLPAGVELLGRAKSKLTKRLLLALPALPGLWIVSNLIKGPPDAEGYMESVLCLKVAEPPNRQKQWKIIKSANANGRTFWFAVDMAWSANHVLDLWIASKGNSFER